MKRAARYERLVETAEKARDALDDILDDFTDVTPPLTLEEARKRAAEAFYPLAEALDALGEVARSPV